MYTCKAFEYAYDDLKGNRVKEVSFVAFSSGTKKMKSNKKKGKARQVLSSLRVV